MKNSAYKLLFLCFVLMGSMSELYANKTPCRCNISIDSFTNAQNNKYLNASNDSIFFLLEEGVEWFKSKGNTCCQSAYYTMKAALQQAKGEEYISLIKYSEKLLESNYLDYSYFENKRLLYYHYSFSLISDSAVYHCIEGLEMAEKRKLDNFIVTFNLFLATEFSKQKILDKAKQYAWKCFQISEKHKESRFAVYTAASYCLYAIAFLDLYENNEIKPDAFLDSAAYFSEKALKVATENNLSTYRWAALGNFSEIAFLKKDYTKAMTYINEILNDERIDIDPETKVEYLIEKAKIHFEISEYLEVTKILEQIKQMSGDYRALYELKVLEMMHKSYAKTGDFSNAYESLLNFKRLNDSLTNGENSKIINDLEQKYQKAKNESAIKELNQSNSIKSLRIQLLGLLVGALVLIVLIVFVISKNRLSKKKEELLKTEQSLNRARMDPHFFFNALGAIQSMVLDNSSSEEVSQYLSKFSKVMRTSLESSYNDLLSLAEEKEFLESYMKVQQMRQPNLFTFEIAIDEALNKDETLIPAMLIQPFIENSIEHGFKNKSKTNRIQIGFYRENNLLKVVLKDNGIGLNSENKHKIYPSRAMQIVKDRLFLLNVEMKTKANYEIKQMDASQGVQVIIKLPIIV